MDVFQKKYRLPFLYLAGFGIGILYANLIAKKYVTVTGIFHEYFLSQYLQMNLVKEDYLWYILRWRAGPMIAVISVANLGIRKLVSVLILTGTGFLAGVLTVAAVLRMGVKGIFLCVAGIFPQYVCYVAAYGMLVYYYYHYPRTEWNLTKTAFTVVVMFIGVLLEVYINPGVVRWFMRAFL